MENKITNGTSTTTFSPDENCTRAQIVTFLWRSKGEPYASDSNNPFTDIASDYYMDAVFWAVKEGITKGTTPREARYGGTPLYSIRRDCIAGLNSKNSGKSAGI